MGGETARICARTCSSSGLVRNGEEVKLKGEWFAVEIAARKNLFVKNQRVVRG